MFINRNQMNSAPVFWEVQMTLAAFIFYVFGKKHQCSKVFLSFLSFRRAMKKKQNNSQSPATTAGPSKATREVTLLQIQNGESFQTKEGALPTIQQTLVAIKQHDTIHSNKEDQPKRTQQTQ